MKSSANPQKKRETALLMSTVLLTLLCMSRPALSRVNILGSWLSGTSHAKEAGVNRALIFIAHGELAGDMNLVSVTYGGQTMTKVIDKSYYAAGGYAYAAAYILDEAGVAAAGSSTFSLTWSTTPTESGYASVFLEDVNQAALTGASASGGSTVNPVTTSALATSSGDMVILAATCGNKGSYTLNNDFIEAIDQNMASSTGVCGYKHATGADETPSATYSAGINRQTIIGFVVQASFIDPNKAANPSPSNGASNVSVSAGLSWDAPAGYAPTSYDVYFGTNPSAHSNPKNTVYTNSYDPPGNLAGGTTYYWAVDSNDAGTIYAGYDWSFTTYQPPPVWRVDARCF